jgi:hypothetical protein
MLVVETLTKVANFIPVKTAYKEKNIVEINMKEVSRLHGVPKEIFSYRSERPKVWIQFLEGFVQRLWDKFKS